MTKPDTPTLTAALAAVETASDRWHREGAEGDWRVTEAAENLVAALRAARESGASVCVLSRESVEGVRSYSKLSAEAAEIEAAGGSDDYWEAKAHAAECVAASTCAHLARDLSPLLAPATKERP